MEHFESDHEWVKATLPEIKEAIKDFLGSQPGDSSI